MKLIRSWPKTIPEGRAYVVDGIERLVMSGFDYRCLADVDDDVVLIEWDIAIGGGELAEFMRRAADNPEQVRVSPYLLYPPSTGGKGTWYCHRVRAPGNVRWVTGPEDQVCHLFGFGLIYMPRVHLLQFMETLKPKDRFTDTTFSYWHNRHRRPYRAVPIDWDLPATHLHYELPEVPDCTTPP